MLKQRKFIREKSKQVKGSLTVEASLIMPIFLYAILAFLYFIQIFTLQEKLQSALTQMGMSLAKSSYFYKDFNEVTEMLEFDKSIIPKEILPDLDSVTDQVISNLGLSIFAENYMDTEMINRSCIKGGFEGIDFFHSSLHNEEGDLDIVISYQVSLPIQIFHFGELDLLQRVKVRAWTGQEEAPLYSSENSLGDHVYITQTGKVYHARMDCSHIKLSIRAVNGIPYDLRNDNGGKYYACESCTKGNEPGNTVFYITNDGTRYHTKQNCSKLKRTVSKILRSEVGSRTPCKRCGK